MTRSIRFTRHKRSDCDDRYVDFRPVTAFHAGLIAVAALPLEKFGIRLDAGRVWPIILGIVGLILSIVGWYVLKKRRSDVESRFKLIRPR